MSRYLRTLIIAAVVLALLFGLDYLFPNGGINPGLRSYLSDNTARLLPYIFRIAMLSGIAITLAVSLNLINGFTGQFSIGHAGFMAVGAYSSAYFSVTYGANLAATLGGGKLGWAISLVAATLVGSAVAGLAGLVVGVPSLRLKGDYLAIVTLGFGQIIVVFLNNIEVVGGARGYSGIPIVKSFFWIFLIAILTIVIVYNIVHSAFGRALISIREDELAAEAMGVNTTRYKVMAFVISSAMAGAGGVLLAHFDGYLNPKSFEFIKSFEILIMIILGGLGSIVGSVLGAILLTVLPEALRGFAEYRMVIYSLLLIILMITRPQGLLGTTAAFKGWRGRKRTKSRTEAEEITAEDTRNKASVEKATLGERQSETSLGEKDEGEKKQ